MEGVKRLITNAERRVRRTVQNALATVIRTFSDTSRMHVVVAQGHDVFDALCTLEPQDEKGLRRGIGIQSGSDRLVPIRVRKFGEYSIALVFIEWPMNPSDTTTMALVETLRSLLKKAENDERQVDGITLVADDSIIASNLNFYACLVDAFQAVEQLGYPPRVIVQHCSPEHTGTGRLPFKAEYLLDTFFTSQNLHWLLAKRPRE